MLIRFVVVIHQGKESVSFCLFVLNILYYIFVLSLSGRSGVVWSGIPCVFFVYIGDQWCLMMGLMCVRACVRSLW